MKHHHSSSKAFNELFNANENGFHHDADCLVHKRRDGDCVARFGQLQPKRVMVLNGVPIWLHMNRDVGIVRIKLFGALGNQMPQQRRRIIGNVRTDDLNDWGVWM